MLPVQTYHFPVPYQGCVCDGIDNVPEAQIMLLISNKNCV